MSKKHDLISSHSSKNVETSALSVIESFVLQKNGSRIAEGGMRIKRKEKEPINDNSPLVSVITIVLNGEKHLEKTILSIVGQSYGFIEYIIIDGGSTDSTIDIIRQYDEKIEYWVSEPDKGVSDAFNKGVSLSRGDYIQILNADDWLSENHIEMAVSGLRRCDCDFVYGDLILHDDFDSKLYRFTGQGDYEKTIYRKMPRLNHPTILAKKEIFLKIGGFNTEYKYAMDYEWLLRGHKAGYRGQYIPKLIGHMRRGGLSDNNYLDTEKEVFNISLKYGYPYYLAYPYFLYRVSRGRIGRLLEKILPFELGKKIVGSLKRYS